MLLILMSICVKFENHSGILIKMRTLLKVNGPVNLYCNYYGENWLVIYNIVKGKFFATNDISNALFKIEVFKGT